MNRKTSPIVLANLFGNPETWDLLTWQPFREGIEAAWIHQNDHEGSSAALLRYQPGARGPVHRHAGWEHIIVLSGSQMDQKGTYDAGSFVANPPGSEHCVLSPLGCVALLIWEKTPIFVDAPISSAAK